eukprot:CAMPEP_0168247738 /NCGR_PEP_ID=MMETSP0141_2-20121125/1074_1 /TAXON_ID=44445 /ORGANISM="Pseudo-nitzschia australis, Strain 10249 10 AB" /LENGTH=242 /DNA_ID=CAMNT_0008183577 /DNA_START=14 /DNA_END=742 /DNA_ORIENTATION=+
MGATKMVPKLVLVDRDGVVNHDVGAPGVIRASQLELTPGAALALGRLRRAGCTVALITNQSCVGKGLITEADLVDKIHGRLQEILLEQDQDAKFDHIFYCTSLADANDHRMKPNPGMIEEAMKLVFESDAAVHRSSFYDSVLFVGDALRDMEAATRAGVRTRILVETGYGREIMGGEKAPNLDGEVKVVSEAQSNTKLAAAPDNTSDDSPKPSIFPFLYAKNLHSAVEWVITSTDTTTSTGT